MPQFAYALCAETGAVDAFTNRLSVFHVVETIPICRGLDRRWKPVQPLSFRVHAAFYRQEHDSPRQEFEGSILLFLPGHPHPLTATISPFCFTRWVHRVTSADMQLDHVPGPGLLRVEVGIRPAGGSAWVRGHSPILLVEEAPEV